jgi:hypothetical protein
MRVRACPTESANRTAVLWGTVAASFMIEGRELWNGEDPWGRMEALRARLEE